MRENDSVERKFVFLAAAMAIITAILLVGSIREFDSLTSTKYSQSLGWLNFFVKF